MYYKVFLVEDEAAARVGIRDNVDWKAAGFEFCGEAPDGDIALPLIETTQPDLLITDIKMPFMDGLQLSKLVRQRLPWIKVVILSGHDEFEYAQSAIELGVSEYLLKPITAVKLHDVLTKIAALLDQEREEREKLKQLQTQLQDNLALQRERLLFQLVVGGVSSAEAIDQCQRLGLNIIAPYYLVALIKITAPTAAQHLAYAEYQQIQAVVADLIYPHPGTFLTPKSAEELLLIITGGSLEELTQDGAFLTGLIQQEVENAIPCIVTIGIGSPYQRLTEISQSFAEALTQVKNAGTGAAMSDWHNGRDPVEKLKLEQTAVEHYLKGGANEDFAAFYSAHLHPLAKAAIHSYLVKHYLFVDLILTTAEFISELGGDPTQVIPEIQNVEELLADIKTTNQIRETINKLFSQAFAFRNNHTSHERNRNIHEVKAFIDEHFANPDLMLNDVAAKANLSPSYFSAIFSDEFGESYKEYITRLRMERAKELLLTTNLKCSEIAYQSGYNDPHYFSHVFRKNTGLPPQQFRQQPQAK
ncbi:MAG: helix-turn-helix domain-containing protein [Anaerolinea sp.]|nr:helix-turn-helix domain-containing protein [Anaerolinea sp.]